MKAGIVNYKDLMDKKKNPTCSLGARDILQNPKIPKKSITGEVLTAPKTKRQYMNDDDIYDLMRDDAGDWLENALIEFLNKVVEDCPYRYYHGRDNYDKMEEHLLEILKGFVEERKKKRLERVKK
jgi:hypothetical protein